MGGCSQAYSKTDKIVHGVVYAVLALLILIGSAAGFAVVKTAKTDIHTTYPIASTPQPTRRRPTAA